MPTTVEVTPPAVNQVAVAAPAINQVTVTPAAVNQIAVTPPAINQIAVTPPAVHTVEQLGQVFERTVVASRVVRIPFTFADTSPHLIAIQSVNELIVDAVIVVQTPFDGTTSVLALGVGGDAGLILPASDVKPKRAAQYGTSEIIGTTDIRNILLTITPDSSTAGAGFVLLTFARV